jgi:hypothetical protein
MAALRQEGCRGIAAVLPCIGGEMGSGGKTTLFRIFFHTIQIFHSFTLRFVLPPPGSRAEDLYWCH